MADVRVALASVLVVVLVLAQVYADEEIVAHPHFHLHSGPYSFEGITAPRLRSSETYLTFAELRATYNIPNNATGGAGLTIAVIDPYGASTAEADLGVFSTQWSLPACTTANGCFKKVDQNGGTDYPPDDTSSSNWGLEVALDIQTIHYIAPGATILLVVATSSSLSDLFTAISYATTYANYVSMSWAFPEGTWVTEYSQTYFGSFPSVAFFASTGDGGTTTASRAVGFPSTSPFVVAVGGTSVYTTSGTFSSEKGWSDSIGGCSAYLTAPAAQASNSGYASLGCSGKRAVPDVSYDADPNSGVHVYYSVGCPSPPTCYYQIGGTSLAAPLFAAHAALTGAVVNVTYVYGTHITYRDITSGTSGSHSCKTGLDLVTGRGSWIGTS